VVDRLDLSPELAAKTLRELVEVIPDAIVVIDWSGRLVLVNRQTEKLFGYHSDELLGQPIELCIYSASQTSARTPIVLV
jgi:PAS domain S-box-containing protein